MQESTARSHSSETDITVVELAAAVFRRWPLTLVFAVGGVVVGLLASSTIDPVRTPVTIMVEVGQVPHADGENNWRQQPVTDAETASALLSTIDLPQAMVDFNSNLSVSEQFWPDVQTANVGGQWVLLLKISASVRTAQIESTRTVMELAVESFLADMRVRRDRAILDAQVSQDQLKVQIDLRQDERWLSGTTAEAQLNIARATVARGRMNDPLLVAHQQVALVLGQTEARGKLIRLQEQRTAESAHQEAVESSKVLLLDRINELNAQEASLDLRRAALEVPVEESDVVGRAFDVVGRAFALLDERHARLTGERHQLMTDLTVAVPQQLSATRSQLALLDQQIAIQRIVLNTAQAAVEAADRVRAFALDGAEASLSGATALRDLKLAKEDQELQTMSLRLSHLGALIAASKSDHVEAMSARLGEPARLVPLAAFLLLLGVLGLLGGVAMALALELLQAIRRHQADASHA